jgi:hypothetical protein
VIDNALGGKHVTQAAIRQRTLYLALDSSDNARKVHDLIFSYNKQKFQLRSSAVLADESIAAAQRTVLRLFDLPIAATSTQIQNAVTAQLQANVERVVFDRLRINGITTDVFTNSATVLINNFEADASPKRTLDMDGLQVVILDERLGFDRNDPDARAKAFQLVHEERTAMAKAATERAMAEKAAAEQAAAERAAAEKAAAEQAAVDAAANAQAAAKAANDAKEAADAQAKAEAEILYQQQLLEQQHLAKVPLQDEQQQLEDQQQQHQQPHDTTMETDSAERAKEALARQAAAEITKRRENAAQSAAAKKPTSLSSTASIIARSLAAASPSKTGPEHRAGPGTPNAS